MTSNLEMIYGNQAKAEIEKERRETNQTQLKTEDERFQHIEGAKTFDGEKCPLTKSSDYMAGYVDGYQDCHDFVNGKLDRILKRMK